MKKVFALALVFAMFLCCAGCGSSAPAAKTETTVADTTEAQLQETEVATEAPTEAEVLEEAPYEYVMTNLAGGAMEDEYFPEVYDLRMYAPKNGNTRFEIDYLAPADLKVVAVAFVGEEFAKTPEGWSPEPIICAAEDQQAAFRYEQEEKTSGEAQTLSFEIETDLLDSSNGVEIHFCDENYVSMSWLLVHHNQFNNLITNGTPVGDVKTLETSIRGNVEVHSFMMQTLDNGYVRFTVEYTAPKELYVAFLNAPAGDRFLRYGFEVEDSRNVIVSDIPENMLEGQTEVAVSFYEFFWHIFDGSDSRIVAKLG